MKRILVLALVFVLGSAFVGCDFSKTSNTTGLETTTTDSLTTNTNTTTTLNTTQSGEQVINLFSINDFHGGAYSDINNLSPMGAFLKFQLDNTDNAVVLANGDIFQGTALSNYYYGLPIVDVMNYVGFDGFVIGNHEFDWGIDKITQYRDGNLDNGEMDYPLLAANIVYEDTGDPLENTIPYITKQVGEVKVGIIGVIGDVINSISASRTENIIFTDAADAIYDYTEVLRTEEDCDIVVVYIHEGSGFNSEILNFTGDHYVDAIFNAHTHQDESGLISRSSGFPLVYAQASNQPDSLFVKISLTYDLSLSQVVDASTATYTEDYINGMSDTTIENILYEYDNEPTYRAFVDQVLCDVDSTYYRNDLSTWGASVLRDYAGVDVGAINSGGFRSTMYSGSLTMGDLIVIYPFDNYIKTSEMTGAQLLSFYEKVLSHGYDVVFDDGLTYDNGDLYIDGVLVDDQTLYTVGAVDYIFDKTYYDFLDGQNITQTTMLIRDLLAEDLSNVVGSFNPYDGTSYLLGYYATVPTYDLRIKESIIQ